MKSYSGVNLLAKEYNDCSDGETLFKRFIRLKDAWLDSRTTSYEIEVVISYAVYLRTQLICDYIESTYELEMPVENFLNILYEDFIHRCMKNHKPLKILEELSRYDNRTPNLLINDPMKNKIFTIKRENVTEVTYNLVISKKQLKRGEIILAELDEVLPNAYFTVEELISRLWLNYISDFSEGTNEKAVDKMIKMGAANF